MPDPSWFTPPDREFRLSRPSTAGEIVEDFVYRGDDVERRIADRREAGWEVLDQTKSPLGTLLKFVGR